MLSWVFLEFSPGRQLDTGFALPLAEDVEQLLKLVVEEDLREAVERQILLPLRLDVLLASKVLLKIREFVWVS